MEDTMNQGERTPILELVDIDKSFPGVHAVNHVNIALYEGEILGISGENGAGKSTMLMIISGVLQADSGDVFFMGKRANYKNPKESIDAGISIIYQELTDLGNLSVAENIFLGRLPRKNGIIDWKKMNIDAKRYLDQYDIHISPTVLMKDLSMTEKQLIEIIKAVSTNSRVIIMDEPTSSLGIDNVARLMKIVRSVNESGIAFIFISHRLEELVEICHRIVVLRDGVNVADFARKDFNINAVVEKMVGHTMKEFYTKMKIDHGAPVLKLQDVTSDKLDHVSLEVEEGAIIGLYGMAGAGQNDILATIFGVEHRWEGSMELFGKDYHPKHPKDAIARKVCYITEDRKGSGLVLKQSMMDNTVMGNLDAFSKFSIVNWQAIKNVALKWQKALKIKTSSVQTKVGTLSGGNQQKVILGRWIEHNPKLFLFNEPTRGIDVATKHELFEIVQNLCKQGVSVLMISSDMLEMLSIADKIYVVCDGKITACFKQKDATQQKLMKAAVNVMEDEQHVVSV